MGWTDRLTDGDEASLSPIPSENVFMRPVYNSVSAGFGAVAENDVVDYVPTVINAPGEKDLYIWITVKGDSMSPLIDDGSRILVKKQSSVDDGQIAVVLIEGEEAFVKKIKISDRDQSSLCQSTLTTLPSDLKARDIRKNPHIVGLVKEVSKSLQ